jgi:hypothetical protein
MAKNPIPPQEPTSSKGISPIGPEPAKPGPDVSSYQKYYKEAQAPTEPPKPAGPSPLELEKGSLPPGTVPSMDNLLNQISVAQNYQLELQKQMQYPYLKFNPSEEKLLSDKLREGNNSLANLSNKLGLPVKEMPTPPVDANPIYKLTGALNYGQTQLAEAKMRLQSVISSGQEMKPGELLLMQINISQAQQAFEYSSMFLSKIIDAINKFMNMQI